MNIKAKEGIANLTTSIKQYMKSRSEGGDLDFKKEVVTHCIGVLIVLGISLVLAVLKIGFALTHSPEELESLAFIEALSPWTWLSSLMAKYVAFVLGSLMLLGIFVGVIFFHKGLFKIIARVSSFTFSVTLFGLGAGLIIFFGNQELLNEGTDRIEIFAGAVNYAIATFYCGLTLFVSIGFYNSKNSTSYTLKITSVAMIVISLTVATHYDYRNFTTFVYYAVFCSLIAIALLMFGIYLAIRSDLKSESALKKVREKSRETKFNDVIFGCIGLVAVIPLFIWFAWIFYKSGYNTIEFICMNVNNFPLRDLEFGSQCVELGL